MKKTIAILGVTGSVGRQAADVALCRGYAVDLVSANTDVPAAEEAVRRLSPRAVAMADPAAARDLAVRLADTGVRVLSGPAGIEEGIRTSPAETVVNAILGEAGLLPTLATVDSGKRLALANKESLVIAGAIVTARARARGAEILPVDSEHSAIFQSLLAGRRDEVRRILLTASGGPFYGYTRERLRTVTREQTLAHPTWRMGKKITVDSATLMNKGFEIMEAVHLFGVPADRVEVLIHRESILHSAVEYIDNAVIGQMAVPDMRLCVQYAVDYPDRAPAVVPPLDLLSVGTLTFLPPDPDAFPLLPLARRAMQDGGGMPAVVNAADETAVAAFLAGELSFSGISEAVLRTYEDMTGARSASTVEEILAADRRAREVAGTHILHISKRGFSD